MLSWSSASRCTPGTLRSDFQVSSSSLRRDRPGCSSRRPAGRRPCEHGHRVLGPRHVALDERGDHERSGRWRPGRTARRAARPPSSSWASAARRSGAAGRATTPPPANCGARIEPWRARPVPFWRYGFLPPPLTSPRVLVACVPCRAAASLGHHDLVDQRHVDLGARRSRRAAPHPGRLAGRRDDADGGHQAPSWRLRRPDGAADQDQAAAGPGTAPLISSRLLLGVHGVHGQAVHGGALAAHPAGHPHALEHPARGGAARRWIRASGACAGCRARRTGP